MTVGTEKKENDGRMGKKKLDEETNGAEHE